MAHELLARTLHLVFYSLSDPRSLKTGPDREEARGGPEPAPYVGRLCVFSGRSAEEPRPTANLTTGRLSIFGACEFTCFLRCRGEQDFLSSITSDDFHPQVTRSRTPGLRSAERVMSRCKQITVVFIRQRGRSGWFERAAFLDRQTDLAEHLDGNRCDRELAKADHLQFELTLIGVFR